MAEIAIQDRGRLKPIDTFAMESLLYLTGKRRWKGMSPVECVFGWLFTFEEVWDKEAFIAIHYLPLKKQVSLPESRNYFSPDELRSNAPLGKLIREAAIKKQRKEKISDIEKKAIGVQNQLSLIHSIVSGAVLYILPNPEGTDRDWASLASLAQQASDAWLPYEPDQKEKLGELIKSLLEAYTASDAGAWNESAPAFQAFLRDDLSKGRYPRRFSLKKEIHYNHFRPFRWAWIFYATAFVGLLLYLVSSYSICKFIGTSLLGIALLTHMYGFILRCSITERPPVTSMYESVIWVSFVCVLFSLLIWLRYKNWVIPTAASVFSVAGLVLGDNLPSVLDPGIHPLMPVLRSNFWLTIHVLTITSSYAAFALSLCLGNVVLGNYLFRPSNIPKIQQFSLFMYRAQQIGVVLLAAGTILGGVWADYSWGRFWGWDPKEVWALIALLVYVAVLHGRFTGWLRGFGFVACTVVSFLAILMAWYGVNFVLGAGLHSYGFGSGGLSYVMGYVLLQLAFIGAAYSRHRKVRVADEINPAIFPRT